MLNRLNLLEHNYIIVPPPSGFVSAYFHVQGVQEVLTASPKVLLEDKVHLETYYHHSHDDIQMNETP
jgi:hypothetical protein